jgi:hypothetical protein
MANTQQHVILVAETLYTVDSSEAESVQGVDVSVYQETGAWAYAQDKANWFRYDAADTQAAIADEVVKPAVGPGSWLLDDGVAEFLNVSSVVGEWSGWPNKWPTPPPATMAIDEVTQTFTITPTPSFDIYVKSRRFRKTAVQTVQWTDTEGMHYFYFNASGVLTHTTSSTPWHNALLGDGVLCSTICWDATNNEAILWAEERHGFMPGPDHLEFHEAFGARLVRGGGIYGFDADGTGNDATNAQWAMETSTIYDEDVRLTFTHNAPQPIDAPAELPVLFFWGATPVVRRKAADTYPMIYSGTAGYVGANGRIAFNELTGGAWTLTEMGEAEFAWVHCFCTTDCRAPYEAFMGFGSHADKATAEGAVDAEVTLLEALLQESISHEWTYEGSVLVQSSAGYGNVPKARVVTLSTGAPYWDGRHRNWTGAPSVALVLSVFGRTGAVSPVAGDYAASEVTNDSGVAGAMVDDALDNLNAAIAAIKAKSILTWGDASIANTTTTRYMSPGHSDGIASSTAIRFRAPFAATYKNLRVRHGTPAGNGQPVVYTLRVNGVASTLTVSMASTAADGSDLVHTVAVNAGDLIDMAVTKAAGIVTSPSDIMASLEVLA